MRPWAVHIVALPVCPIGDVLEVFIEDAVLEIFGAQNAAPAAGIHKIFEPDRSGGTISTYPGG